jgi:FMN phosphatase YigB (HAD superfamily)
MFTETKIKYLLLDLDGTLVEFDIDVFIREYLRLIQNQFSNYTFAKSVPKWIMTGTDIMLNNLETITNKEKFLGYFSRKTGLSEDEIWEIFLHFYQNDYEQIKTISAPVLGAKQFLEQAVAKKYILILATQPVFPEIAIKKRLAWAGVDHLPFRLITHIENMYASKPHLQYFEQILSILGAMSSECLMIGNDREMDLASEKAGIPAYYLTQQDDKDIPEDQKFYGDFDNLGRLLDIF